MGEKRVQHKQANSVTICALLFLACLAFLCTACSTKAVLLSKPEKANLTVGKSDISGTTPITSSIGRTTFGSYPFKVEKEGYEPMYGRLPLNVSGVAITMDILFFTPALFFNAQRAFPFYEFDLEKRVVNYKRRRGDAWKEYVVKEEEQVGAMSFFGVSSQGANVATMPTVSPTDTVPKVSEVEPSGDTVDNRLRNAKKLYDDGLISEKEYEVKKAEILKKL
jgi:hypothetical protein